MDLCRPTISISWLRSEGRIGGHAMVSGARAGLVQFRASSVLASIARRHCEFRTVLQPVPLDEAGLPVFRILRPLFADERLAQQ